LVTPPWQAIIAPIERSIDWTINAKMYATESIAVDEIVRKGFRQRMPLSMEE
jgi:hypothetical protein